MKTPNFLYLSPPRFLHQCIRLMIKYSIRAFLFSEDKWLVYDAECFFYANNNATERSMDCMNPYECAKAEVQLCPTKDTFKP